MSNQFKAKNISNFSIKITYGIAAILNLVAMLETKQFRQMNQQNLLFFYYKMSGQGLG